MLLAIMLVTSCSKDDSENGSDGSTSLTVSAIVQQVTVIKPNLPELGSAGYKWSIEGENAPKAAIFDATSRDAAFSSIAEGKYTLKVIATAGANIYTCNVTVNVAKNSIEYSPYISKVFDLLPAPGQFTNELPKYEAGMTKEGIIAAAESYVVGKKNGSLISLGGFGGYIIFGFDHMIVNEPGYRDFRIMGNAFYANANPNPDAPKGGSCEPGIIMVSYDANGNGKPDDKWYEIAGSEYNKPTTIKNYEITYYRPKTEESTSPEGFVSIKEYIKWEDNQGNSGYKVKNIYHKQSYYPQWIKEDKITYKGTLLAKNAVDESGNGSYWVLYALGFGYADNSRNTEDDSAIDISWAVDETGKPVHLPGINFVKVYTGLNQEAGWLGETSTEVAGAYDLHLSGEKIKSN